MRSVYSRLEVRATRARLAPSALAAILGTVLFVASAAFVFWRNSQVGVLADISYIANTATRIAAGEVPYRDFPLAQAPLEFVTQAALIKLAGPHWPVQIAYASIVGGIGTVLTFVIARRLLRDAVAMPDLVAGLVCLPLVPLGVYAVYPHPFYDPDTCVLVLGSLLAALVTLERGGPLPAAVAGALLAVVPFAKQNTGGALVLAMIAAVSAHALAHPGDRARVRAYFGGLAAGLALILLIVQATAGVDQYIRWTVGFAASGRGLSVERLQEFAAPAGLAAFLVVALRRHSPRSRLVIGVLSFIALLSAIVLTRSVAFAPGFFPPTLVAASTLALLRARREPASVALLTPVVGTIAMLGVLESQGLSGSSFASFPLLIVCIASMVRDLAWSLPGWPRVPFRASAGLTGALLVVGSIYTLSNARLRFADVQSEGAVIGSTTPALAGLSTRGPYIEDLDAIVKWTQDNVPPSDGFVFLPGEDPVYFALGRTPALPSVYFFDVATPYTPSELARIADERGLRWVFVKDRLQLVQTPPLTEEIATALTARATLVTTVSGYRIYRR